MEFIKTLKTRTPVMHLIQSHQWKSFRNWMIRKKERRDQSHYTHFLRLPTQFEALAGPVMEYVLGNTSQSVSSKSVRIAIVGCSIGAEVYTIASILKNKHPDLDLQIEASDIEERVLEKAREGRYTKEEVYSHDLVTDDFINQTFQNIDGFYVVKPSVAECVTFKVADVFSPELTTRVMPADVVFAQNFLFHMQPAKANEAFDCIVRLLKPRSALFVDGIDLPVKIKATKRHGLKPLNYKIMEIHNENLRLGGWPWHYWGLEPFSEKNRDWRRRYATIFFQGNIQ